MKLKYILILLTFVVSCTKEEIYPNRIYDHHPDVVKSAVYEVITNDPYNFRIIATAWGSFVTDFDRKIYEKGWIFKNTYEWRKKYIISIIPDENYPSQFSDVFIKKQIEERKINTNEWDIKSINSDVNDDDIFKLLLAFDRKLQEKRQLENLEFYKNRLEKIVKK
jgi:hypothetical protein